jgi:hypothetical protein
MIEMMQIMAPAKYDPTRTRFFYPKGDDVVIMKDLRPLNVLTS